MRLKKPHWIGIGFGIFIILIGMALLFYGGDVNIFLFLFGIGAGVIALPFVVGIIIANNKEQKMNTMFLEFARNLAESVASGTPVSKSIVNVKGKNYGALSSHIVKLANQIELGIPVEKAFENFSYDIGSPVIKRAVALIQEAEKSGGEIDYILESVARSMSEIEKLKKERRAIIYNLVVQGYIIFFIFIGIMLVMQFKILPLTEGVGSLGLLSGDISSIQNAGTAGTGTDNAQSLGRSFLYLLLAQGFFTGLTIGKLAEGSVKAGIKHSFILVIMAFLVSTGANILLG